MKWVFLIFFFFTAAEYTLAQESSLIYYNKMYQSAEKQILNGNYCTAKDILLELGKNSPLYTTEKINGLVSSLECDSDDHKSIEFFITTLFEIGAPVEYFETELGEYSYFSTESWGRMKEEKPEFDRNNRYIKKVGKMVEIDQAGRGYSGMDSIEWADFRVYMMMQELSREVNGFLGPEQLGFDYEPLGFSSNSQYAILMIHQIKSRPYEWGAYLPKMYWDGLIDPRSFTFYYLLANPCDKLELSCFPYPPENIIRAAGHLYVCSGDAMERIDKNRDSFYLDSVQDQINKALYRVNTNKPFRIGRSIPTFDPHPNEDPTEFHKELKEMGFEKHRK
ncbi:MAG: hypothetical protein EA411_09610 [Saprospirales bacterium]|nr:MAG: hypothetical protein EA411_09610 [Saprospirales bacterium]